MSAPTAVSATPPPRVAAVVAAWNEQETVADVVRTIRESPLVSETIVVDNRSTDETAARAARAGARVVSMPVPGKGNAMAAGVASTDAPIILFLDADLKRLNPGHIEQLVRPVATGQALMSRGLIDKGVSEQLTRLRAKAFPVLTGQRAMTREVFEALRVADVGGWSVESSLNAWMWWHGHRPADVFLGGLTHVEKRDKYSSNMGGRIANAKALGKTQAARATFYGRRMLGWHVGTQSAVEAARALLQGGSVSQYTEAAKTARQAVRLLRL